jgi:hypothetical protein
MRSSHVYPLTNKKSSASTRSIEAVLLLAGQDTMTLVAAAAGDADSRRRQLRTVGMRLAGTTATIVAGLLAVLGTSCSSGTGPLDDGTYRVTVSGSVTASFEGRAGFGVLAEGWGIMLRPRDPGGDGWIVRFDRNGPRPRAGETVPVGEVMRGAEIVEPYTYAIGAVIRYVDPGPGTAWDTRSGWIRITRSTPRQLAGTFEITAQPYSDNAPGPITAKGAFTAVCFLDAGC